MKIYASRAYSLAWRLFCYFARANERPAEAPRPVKKGWRLHFYTNGQRISLYGRTRRSLLALLNNLAAKGCTPRSYRIYQRNDAGTLYRTSLARFLATA